MLCPDCQVAADASGDEKVADVAGERVASGFLLSQQIRVPVWLALTRHTARPGEGVGERPGQKGRASGGMRSGGQCTVREH